MIATARRLGAIGCTPRGPGFIINLPEMGAIRRPLFFSRQPEVLRPWRVVGDRLRLANHRHGDPWTQYCSSLPAPSVSQAQDTTTKKTSAGEVALKPNFGSLISALNSASAQNDKLKAMTEINASNVTLVNVEDLLKGNSVEGLFIDPAHALPDQRFLSGGAQYPQDFPWADNIWFRKHMPPEYHPAFFSSSRWTLNVTRAAMARMGSCPSGRLFEALALGFTVLAALRLLTA
jgi:hypothetical protein